MEWKRIKETLWGTKEEQGADPDDLSVENAYKTRWIWYHTILAGLMFFANIIMFGIFILLAVKL